MGGHGALVLSTHFPDLLVAALPASAWLSVETYGGGTPHEQMSFSDSALRSIFESAYDQYASDFHAENLLGIPFLARVGSKDKTVPRKLPLPITAFFSAALFSSKSASI